MSGCLRTLVFSFFFAQPNALFSCILRTRIAYEEKKKGTFYFIFGSKRREGKEVNINNDMSNGIVLFVV